MAAAVSQGHYATALKCFDTLSAEEQKTQQALYLAGFCWKRRHDVQKAKTYLKATVESGFEGYPGWQTASEILQDIATIEKIAPPFNRDVPDQVSAKLHVFAKPTDWSSQILKELPAFVVRARECFGNDIPTINLYIIEKREDYEKFFRLIFQNEPRTWQDGTGDANIFVFCEQNREHKTVLPISRAVANNLHEYGHSLCNTIFGDDYLKLVPHWFDEGVADMVAAPYNKQLFDYSEKCLADKNGIGRVKPTYEQLSKNMYATPDSGYMYSRLMVKEMLKGQPDSTLRKILEQARELRDFDKAIKEVTGISPPDLLQRVIAKYN